MDADRAGCEWAKLLRSPEGSESYPFGVMSDAGRGDAPADILSKNQPPGAVPEEEPEQPASKEAQDQALRAAAAQAALSAPLGPSASRVGSGARTPVSHSESFVKKEDLRKQMTALEGELFASRQMAEKQQVALADLEKRLLARDAENAALQLGLSLIHI